MTPQTTREPFPTIRADAVPWLSIPQMVKADALAIGEFEIGLLQMMEHAGSTLAELTDRLAPPGEIVVLAGGGNNGGGGLSAARHLVNRGRSVGVFLASSRLGTAARHHLATVHRMGIPVVDAVEAAPVVVDAIVGYGLDGPLRAAAAAVVAQVAPGYVVSLDLPSGHGYEGAVAPDATLTLALPKARLRGLDGLFLADIGLPGALWAEMGLDVGSIFGRGRILEITG